MAVNSIFSYDNVLPGVITEIDSKLSSDYDTTLFGTTDSIVVIGTAFDGPVSVPSPVYSVEHASYLFGKNYKSDIRKEASLVTGIEDAWNRGCRTIYGMRINGKDCYKDFNFCADLNYKLRIQSRYPSNIAKQCYLKYDNTDGLETITIYKPASRATLAEKMNGVVESADSVIVNEIRLGEDFGFTKATRLSEVIDLIEDVEVTQNNVLELKILDENGKVVTNDNETDIVTLGHLYPGVYFIGRDKSACEAITSTEVRLVMDDTDQKPYDTFEGCYYTVLKTNTDVSKPLPIFYSSLKDMRAILEKVNITMDKQDDYLKVPEESNKAFPEDKIDYEENSLTNFEIYKKLGSGFAVTAIAERRVSSDGEELLPKVKEAPLSDDLRVQYLGDNGIYGILQDVKIRYHVLASNICADAVISGKLPKASDFMATVSNDALIADGLVRATAKVSKEDRTAAKTFEFVFKKTDEKPVITKDAVKADVVKIIGAGDVSSVTNAQAGELVLVTKTEPGDDDTEVTTSTLYEANDKGQFEAVTDAKFDDIYLAGGKFVSVENGVATEAVIDEDYVIAETNSDEFIVSKDLTFASAIKEAVTDTEEEQLYVFYEDSAVGNNKVSIASTSFDTMTIADLVELLNNSELAKKFNFELTQDGRINKDEYVGEKVTMDTPVTMEADRKQGYDYSLHIPYMTTDNFARQLAQHCMYTELKTYPTHGVIGCKAVSDVSKTYLANKVAEIKEFNWNMYAKNQAGRNMLDYNNQPYNIGRSVTVTLFQNQFTTSNNYTSIVNGATAYAGLISQMDIGQSPTGQAIGITPMYEFSRSQLQTLSDVGVITLRNSFTNGYVVTDGVTMAPNNDLLRRIFNGRIMHFVEDYIRAACEPFIGQANSIANRNSLNTAITAKLNSLLDTLIRRFEFNIVDDGTAEQYTYIEINYVIVPMNEIREIRNSIRVQNA